MQENGPVKRVSPPQPSPEAQAAFPGQGLVDLATIARSLNRHPRVLQEWAKQHRFPWARDPGKRGRYWVPLRSIGLIERLPTGKGAPGYPRLHGRYLTSPTLYDDGTINVGTPEGRAQVHKLNREENNL
jgi:hypothetical protein